MTASVTSPSAPRSRLWFGMFGGAVPWLVHLVGASIIAEWGCFAGIARWQFLGVTAVAWSVIVLSVVTLLIAMAATWLAYRTNRHYHEFATDEREEIVDDQLGTDAFMARTGLWTSGLFVFIILVESFPILYFLTDC